jgi:hypothetical protein
MGTYIASIHIISYKGCILYMVACGCSCCFGSAAAFVACQEQQD